MSFRSNLFVHLVVFHARKRVFRISLSEIIFYFLASSWTINLSNVPHFYSRQSLYSKSCVLCLDWSDMFTTTKSVAGHSCSKDDNVRDRQTVIHNQSKQEWRKLRKDCGKKGNIVTGSPLIVMAASVLKRWQDEYRWKDFVVTPRNHTSSFYLLCCQGVRWCLLSNGNFQGYRLCCIWVQVRVFGYIELPN